MYNGILEDISNLNGGVKIKILNIYNEAGCRYILPQKVVDNTDGSNQICKKILP
jgi:hypothetical protein